MGTRLNVYITSMREQKREKEWSSEWWEMMGSRPTNYSTGCLLSAEDVPYPNVKLHFVEHVAYIYIHEILYFSFFF
jgi:hypothetical protein